MAYAPKRVYVFGLRFESRKAYKRWVYSLCPGDDIRGRWAERYESHERRKPAMWFWEV